RLPGLGVAVLVRGGGGRPEPGPPVPPGPDPLPVPGPPPDDPPRALRPQLPPRGAGAKSPRHVLSPPYGAGPAALADQRLAGSLMGGGGVLVFLPAVAVLLLDWWEREERAAGRADARLDR